MKNMDYEKKYNEALNWMRELYPGLHGATKEDAEHYFPELKESEDSEDERIRKWLIRAVHLIGVDKDICADQETMDEAIAWLEKQKEIPKSADSIPSDCISDAKCENLHNEEGDFVFELRQIISSHRYSDIYGEYINDEEAMASEILELCKCELEKQKEPKPSINIEQLKSLMLQYLQEAANEKVDSDIEAATDKWARKILGYDFEQKPAEWSEEDENALKCFYELIVFGFTENFCDAQTASDMSKWLNTRLKSLRSQLHWKPSEEQIEALSETIEFAPDTFKPKCTLVTLQDDLKKLM